MVTLLDALTTKNPQVDSEKTTGGVNTISNQSDPPIGWVPWSDFTFENLTTIFADQLRMRYQDPAADDLRALPLDLMISNERTLEILLHRYLTPTINRCLHIAVPNRAPHYGAGSRCSGSDGIPDWSCVIDSEYKPLEGSEKGKSYLPGETKLNSKFTPEMFFTNNEEWTKVLGQTIGYMEVCPSRYGFIITDACLVVLRLSYERSGPGIALERSRRQPTTPMDDLDSSFANTSLSESSFADTSFADTSFANTSSASYQDTTATWDVNPPEYAIVKWSEHRPGKLTIKLALWSLAMMATCVDNSINFSYPELDSWHMEGDLYVHNTSGVIKKRVGRNSVIQGPDPYALLLQAGNFSEQAYAQGDQGPEFYQPTDNWDNQGAGAGENFGSEGESEVQGDKGKGRATYGHDMDEGSDWGYGPSGGADGYVSEAETIKGRRKTVQVTIKKEKTRGAFYFTNVRGKRVDTKRSAWKKVDGMYVLDGSHHVYIADEFPR